MHTFVFKYCNDCRVDVSRRNNNGYSNVFNHTTTHAQTHILLHYNCVHVQVSICYITPPPSLVSSQVTELQSHHIYKGLVFDVEGEMNWLQ